MGLLSPPQRQPEMPQFSLEQLRDGDGETPGDGGTPGMEGFLVQEGRCLWCSGFPFGMLDVLSRITPEKSLHLPPHSHPRKYQHFFCHSKVVTGNICPENEEGKQTSQKFGGFSALTSLNFSI